jgi:peptide/nickel transport system permease protein
MTRFIVRRLLLIPIAMILVNFLGFTYAHYARPLRAENTPYVSAQEAGPLLPSYLQYFASLLQLNLEDMVDLPGASRTGPILVSKVVWDATVASFGLLTIVIVLSCVLGFSLGLVAVRNNPPSVRRWLTWISTVGLAMPSFYIGSLLIFAVVFYIIRKGPGTEVPLPIDGFGWDAHLILPTIALVVRPTVQLAQTTAGLLSGELDKQYIVAARSIGHSWRDIRNRYAMRNIMAPLFLMLASLLRVIVGELVLVEWLFRWPGLGRILGWTLVPPQLSSLSGSPMFLNPPVLATTLTIIAGLFLITDFAAAILVRIFDPRVRIPESESVNV